MAQATIAPPAIKTLADLKKRLGDVPLERIWFRPAPGTATEKDVVDADVHENRLCELVDEPWSRKPWDSRNRGWPSGSEACSAHM